MDINKILKELDSKFEILILRGSKNCPEQDIDLFCSRKQFKNSKKFLINSKFTYLSDLFYRKLFFMRFFNSKMIKLDFKINWFNEFPGYYFKIPETKLTSIEHTFFRYFLELRTDKINFFEKNKKIIIKSNFFRSKIDLFRKQPNFKDFIRIINRNKIVMFKYLKLKYFVSYFFGRIREYVHVFNSGKLITILGPDGVGKSTIISKLSPNLNGKSIYMGGKEFAFEAFYRANEQKFLLKPFIFLMRYFENWFRFFKIRFWKLKGKLVFIDRYPKWELVTFHTVSRVNKVLDIIFYKYLFPAPDKIVVLNLDSKKIHLRKKELSIKELNKAQANLKNVMEKVPNCLFIENDKLDNTLNKILNFIYKK